MKNINTSKTILSCAVASALGAGSAMVGADTILKIKIEDVGSTINLGGGVREYSTTLDARSAGFRFGAPPDFIPINPVNYSATSLWTGDAGTGELLFQSAANPTGSFSTGFEFALQPFIPFTFGGNAVGEINIDGATRSPVFDLTTLDFGGQFAGGQDFLLAPDEGTLKVNWLVHNGDNTYKTSFQWEHTITSAEDPSLQFDGFNAQWIVEGTFTVEDGPPIILPSGGDTTVPLGSAYNEPGVACLDVVDGDISANVVTTTNPVGVDLGNPLNDFQVVYNCTDNTASLPAAEATRNVTIGPDISPPDVTLLACDNEPGVDCTSDGSANSNTVNILVDKTYIDGGGTCFDDVDLDIPFSAPGTDPVFTSNPHPPTVDTSAPTNSTPAEITFTCSDSVPNTRTVTRTINVIADPDAPVINLGNETANVTLSLDQTPPDPGFGITCTDTNPVDNPEGSGDPVDITATNLDFNPTTIDTSVAGITEVSYTCSDDAGNPAENDGLVRTFEVVSGQPFEIISMTISDVDDFSGNAEGDGLAGCFAFDAFSPIDPATCGGANRFSSDETATDIFVPAGTAGSTIPGKGTDLDDKGTEDPADDTPIGIRFGVFQPLENIPNPPPLISPGFTFISENFPLVPYTDVPATEAATPPRGFVVISGDTALIRMESFPWSGRWTSSQPNNFFLDPDENTLQAEILEILPVEAGAETRQFKYRMEWSHLITAEEDQTPTDQFAGFTARWLIEGIITASSTPSVLNDPPVITSVSAGQGTNAVTRIIPKDAGIVTATAVATDPNNDALSFLWEGPVTPIGGNTGDSIMFDPADLESGPLALRVTVTDDDANDPLSASESLQLEVVDTPPDPDYGDSDDDGIPDYLDAVDGSLDPTRNAVDPNDPAAGNVVASAGRLRLGNFALSTGRGSFLVTENDIGVEDRINRVDGLGHSGGGIFDFEVVDLPIGGSVRVILPQAVALPNTPIYRKYTPAKGWFDFGVAAGNVLASASRVNGECPGPDSTDYDDSAGLREGDDCIRLTGVDGGAMDADGTTNGKFKDPGTGAGNGPVLQGSGISSTGCNATSAPVSPLTRGDWWILAAFAAGLGWARRKFGRPQR